MNTPLVSVILATYNGSRFLSEAIESLLSQEYPNLELIIINDASTDVDVATIIEKYKKQDTRVHSYRNERNMERSWSKNFWVEKSKWDYIAFIDDDDIWKKNKLSEQVSIIQKNTDIGIIGTYAQFIDESWNILSETNHLKTTSEEINSNILLSNQFIHSSVLIRKCIFLQAWGFPVNMHLCEDYDLWFRILRISKWINIPKILVKYRVRISSTTAKNIYRMKWITIKLIWKYRKDFLWIEKSIIVRILTFPLNTIFILKAWNLIFGRKI